MSRLVEFLYRKPVNRQLTGKAKAAYVLLGVAAAVILVTSYWSSHQALHQIGTTAAIVGMLAINAVSTIRKGGFRAYRDGSMRVDIAILVIWIILLVIWIMDPQP